MIAPRLRAREVLIRVRSAVPEELPRVADFLDLVEVEVADAKPLVMGRSDPADELATRIDEVALPVEIVVAELRLDAHAVDRPDEVAVGDGMARLLDAPQVLGEPAGRCARDKHD